MTTHERTAELAAAIEAVSRAAQVTQAVQRELVTADTLTKKDRSPVTVADFASQAVVCETLQRHFANDPVVGEEDAAELRDEANEPLRASVVEHVQRALADIAPATEAQVLSWIDRGHAEGGAKGRFWTLDPIDGTKGFLRGEQYAIALALIEDGEIVFGALGCPNLPSPADEGEGLLIVASRGDGTWMTPLIFEGESELQPVHVSDIAAAADANFCESVESGHSDQDQSVQIAKKLGITAEPVRMDSQAKYATVAGGSAAIYLRLPTRPGYREKIWDHAAGVIAVEEAGGKVTDVAGKPLEFGHGRQLEANRGVIATNGRIHDAVVAAVRDVLES
ncbi:3'(2'),5'-bisphosphate nucleotidase [Phycisphaerales bacterium AB-hyl4]|uniref:3'(2'),5'-bisphosphate nucleotidase n=1 Tax=Natronomicrosphaera hydrolytica TaxID=3242702 RepID=A0ABV4UAQ4_9BACT